MWNSCRALDQEQVNQFIAFMFVDSQKFCDASCRRWLRTSQSAGLDATSDQTRKRADDLRSSNLSSWEHGSFEAHGSSGRSLRTSAAFAATLNGRGCAELDEGKQAHSIAFLEWQLQETATDGQWDDTYATPDHASAEAALQHLDENLQAQEEEGLHCGTGEIHRPQAEADDAI